MRKNYNFTYFMMFILWMLLKIINKVKATHQGQEHIKVKSQGKGQMRKMIILLISSHLILCIWLQVKVTYQGQSENVLRILCSSHCASGWFALD